MNKPLARPTPTKEAATKITAATKSRSVQPERLFDSVDAAAFLGISNSYLRAMRLRGKGPSFIRIGRRGVRYSLRDLNAWVEAHRVAR